MLRTEAAPPGMLDTFPNVCELDSWFASVAPDYPAGLFEAFLVVCEGDKVVEGSNSATWGKSDVRRDSRQRFSWFIIGARLWCDLVAVHGERHGKTWRWGTNVCVTRIKLA